MTKPINACESVSALLRQLELGAGIDLHTLTVIPLFGPDVAAPVSLLEEALEARTTEILEMSAEGRVNEIRVVHRGDLPLLLLDGEQVLGAKQNRIFNTSYVVPPGAEVSVAVSCVEAGRWASRSAAFQASGTTLSARARRNKLRRLTMAVGAKRGRDADQGAVWRDVREFLHAVGTRSGTEAFNDGFEQRRARLEDQLQSLEPQPKQVGYAAYDAQGLVSLDVFASSSLFARAWRKLARGLLVEERLEPALGLNEAAELLRSTLPRLARAKLIAEPLVGDVFTLHGAARPVALSAVCEGPVVVHLVAA
jgi:hypothetical protein